MDGPLIEQASSARSFAGIMSRDEARKFSKAHPGRLTTDLTLIWVQALLGIATYSYFQNISSFIIGFILVGSAQHGMNLVAHEGAHKLIAPGRKKLNDFVARWLFASAVCLPYSLYRERHLAHHRLVATEDDTKEIYRRNIRGFRIVTECVKSLLGIDYIIQVFAVVRRSEESASRNSSGGLPAWFKREFVPIATTQTVICAALTAIDPWLYPLLWILPNVSMAMLIGKIRSIVEHKPLREMEGVAPGSGYYMDTTLPCLRSVQSTWIERIFISKVNFHFHAVHHLWPFVSYQHLPTLNARLMESPRASALGVTFEKSYVGTIAKLWAAK
jgi:fatty acid desaturase